MRSKHLYTYWGFTALVAVLAVWGTYEHFRAEAFHNSMVNNYNRAFYELTDYVDDINTLLAKSMLISSPSQLSTISAELSRQSAAAKVCISQLPLTDVQLDKTEKFLSQVGDYTYSLSQNVINNYTLTDEDYKNLQSLGNYATTLNNSLSDLRERVFSGDVGFDNSSDITSNIAYASTGSENFSDIEKQFGEYPSLIYDGPFSEHIETMKPKMLENDDEITADQAADIAAKFFGGRSYISYGGRSENSTIDFYNFTTTSDDVVKSVSITVRGGHILQFLSNRNPEGENISFEDATKKAAEFLKKQGFTNMKQSYYDKSGGIAVINFAYEQGGVICYSDLVKVRVALDDGEILGFEAKGYLMSHEYRNLSTPKIDRKTAREKLSPSLEVEEVSLALIPKDSKREVLCYEFRGKAFDRNFLVYINAENGNEEDIQILIESPDGILAM